MCRRISPSVLAAVFLIAGTARSESGVRDTRAASRVTVSIPSVHGADIPSSRAEPGRVAFAASRPHQGARLDLPALRVMSSNGDGSIQLVRRVRELGAAAVSSSPRGRAREEVSTVSRSGATGWTELHDELDASAVEVVSRRPGGQVTVLYEIWSF